MTRFEEDIYKKNIKKIILITLVSIAAFIFVMGSFFVVDAGQRGMVFSSFSGMKNTVYNEGMHFKLPLFDRVEKMNIRTQKQEEIASAASFDLQDVSTTVAVNFVVDQTDLVATYRNIGAASKKEDYMQTEIMNPIIMESVKSVTALYTAEELIQKRPEVKDKIDVQIKERLSKYGIIVLDVSITNFKFSEVFSKAIEDKETAKQTAKKEENNLETVKYIAQQKVEQAKGDAESIKIINEELAKSPQYIDYLTIQRWDGHMPLALGSGSLLSITGDKT
jgi:regulator of protease activity HflC (stomatin/prohibitin superfamily)